MGGLLLWYYQKTNCPHSEQFSWRGGDGEEGGVWEG